jgi:hypothetical protein
MTIERTEIDNSDLLIHIGYHKAGSTWLQRVLFSAEGTGFTQPWRRADVNDWIVLPKQLAFAPEVAAGYFQEGLEKARLARQVPVLSHERLSGNPHSGGWDSQIIADRLRQLFPASRILILVREQRSVVRSAYLQYVREGGAASVRHYLCPSNEGNARLPLFDFDFYAYHRLIECYQGLFGRDRLLVLPFELLPENPAEFVKRVCEFAGVPQPPAISHRRSNESLSALSAGVFRQMNRCFVRSRLNLAPLLPIPQANRTLRRGFTALDRILPSAARDLFDRRLERVVADAVGDRYRESNRRTEELIGMELKPYGYLTRA